MSPSPTAEIAQIGQMDREQEKKGNLLLQATAQLRVV